MAGNLKKNATLKALHVIPSVGEVSSGPSYVVLRLVERLLASHCETKLIALDWYRKPVCFPFLQTFEMGWGPRKLGRSPAMQRWIKSQVSKQNTDVIHNHGMWQMNSIYPASHASKIGVPYVVSPHGSFSPWAMQNGTKLKKLFWYVLQRKALSKAQCFHATSEPERADIRRLGFQQPIAMIPVASTYRRFNGRFLCRLPGGSCFSSEGFTP